MTPSEKCVSQTTALKLRDAGWTAETERSWVFEKAVGTLSEDHWELVSTEELGDYGVGIEDGVLLLAPDAQEIGELLPANFGSETHNWGTLKIHADAGGNCWEMSITRSDSDGGSEVVEVYANEAEARAACWLWLKENKLI